MEQISHLKNGDVNLSKNNFWKLKNKLCPKTQSLQPTAKFDENGQLLSNITELKKLEVRFYKNRLRNRQIKPMYKSLRIFKEYLFGLRVKTSRLRKCPDWSPDQIMRATRSLGSNKARDNAGLIFEIFKQSCAGSDVVASLTMMMNKMRSECLVPDFVRETSITSIFKNKGSRLDLNNFRGVFNVSKVRSILDKLIYLDHYDEIDANMSDSNAGARKRRNVRDNLFVTYAVINNSIANDEDTELVCYDISLCFDSQWYEETMNDMWNVGVRDECFALMSKLNESVDIVVKTPVGNSEKFTVNNVEQQGTCNGPIKCSVQIDSIGKNCYKDKSKLYLYKNSVHIPHL